MKIIITDNFDRESEDDHLLCDSVSEYYGKLIVEFLIDSHCSDYSPNFYKLVEDDYKLYTFEP